ncbi:MAG TPA: hypothetical protein VM580_26470, partial [Labilithrix sp.]|nr:hypothetical protein [Labilithrix sp.]
MKFGAALTLIGLAGGLATLAATQGCGDSGSADDKGATSETGKTVPPAEGSPTTATDERAFAVDALFVGDADRAGTASATAWKKFGYNLDGHITTVTDSNSPDLKTVCKRASGAQASVHQDGDEGTDNAFGSKILPLLQPFAPAVSKTATDAIRKGDFTVMLKVVGLTDDAAQTNTGLSGTLLVGGAFSEDGSKTPTFTTADDWPYIKDPQVALSVAYINKGVFVN